MNFFTSHKRIFVLISNEWFKMCTVFYILLEFGHYGKKFLSNPLKST